MDIFWQGITGHKKIIGQLQKLVQSGKIPHAFLFYGPDGIGKKRAAIAFAASLLCLGDKNPCGICDSCRLLGDDNSRHPDYFLIEPQIQGKSTRAIRIEEIRRLETGLSRLPVVSGRQVVIIDDAWLMNEAAANSLLKTLEEPGSDVVFILLATEKEAVLPTIVSRCTPVAFGILTSTEIIEILLSNGYDEQKSKTVAALAGGSAGRALRLLGERADYPVQALDILEKIAAMRTEQILAAGAELAGMERSELGEWLYFLRLILRDLLVVSSGGDSIYNTALIGRLIAFLPQVSWNQITKMLALSGEFEKRLSSNANIKLQMEAFLLRLHDVIEEE